MISGARVYVSGEQDGEEFCCNVGTIVRVDGEGEDHMNVLIRFDDWSNGHGEGHNEWHFREADRDEWTITGNNHEPKSIGPSTYLNGLEDCMEFRPAIAAEPARPRFATAWMSDSDQTFTFTGEAFMTLEHAEEFARMTLESDGSEGQIAVFEIRSVHLARLDIRSEVA
jgi:hypothetical protein